MLSSRGFIDHARRGPSPAPARPIAMLDWFGASAAVPALQFHPRNIAIGGRGLVEGRKVEFVVGGRRLPVLIVGWKSKVFIRGGGTAKITMLVLCNPHPMNNFSG